MGFEIPGLSVKFNEERKYRDAPVLLWDFPGCVMHPMRDGCRRFCKANDVKEQKIVGGRLGWPCGS